MGSRQKGATRDARAKWAKKTITGTIPALLQGDTRARKGVESAELIVNPPPPANMAHRRVAADDNERRGGGDTSKALSDEDATEASASPSSLPAPVPRVRISMRVVDTLQAASTLVHERGVNAGSPAGGQRSRRQPGRVAILNMASPLKPGGGVLTGASSQEESLCARTTLYPSLREEFYRLPEVGAVYTPDVLVFTTADWGKDNDDARPNPDGLSMLPRRERFYVDVITAAMLRFPDVVDEAGGEPRKESVPDDGVSGGGPAPAGPKVRTYAAERDRELVMLKMRAVLRIARDKGVGRMVLGAWGCGAYGNPVGEIAKAWRKALLGAGNGRRGRGGTAAAAEGWDGLEVVFAINDARMASAFATSFGAELNVIDGGDGEQDTSLGSSQAAP